MFIETTKYQDNKNFTDMDTLKLYVLSSVVFLIVAFIPSIIF